ncbi:MAG: TonB-dependent receptor [Sphingomonas bacterium]|uniref:TonB-dependent receptor plug domain-containing protein n=1 Tax=Sphingomonas bacterium TaxID=1895847 RepID=UPI002623128C|nr:TonB-dependent receptor [Sphingomonas bacterium]MDB5704786.1 TonB-dependent receptor [Sphingomonas bacterium]
MTISFRARLLATAITLLAGTTPALAQEAMPAAAPDLAAQEPGAQGPDDAVAGDIVVTGSILRTAREGPSPVTTLTAETLDQRGISTVQDAIQQLSSNNGPALTNSFTANGAFAGGASAASLRGLSTNSTLVLFDGMRAAYFPLADDGSRNFVDLNTIPDDIVDRIEVLRDGASASYGADAIAGVINIITKRNVQGLSGRVEAGVSENGVAANQRVTLTAGKGDLDAEGYNAYLSGFYLHNEAVYNRDLPYPYNTDDLRGLCSNRTGTTQCGPNNVMNGLDVTGHFPDLGFTTGASTLFVRPYDGTNTTALGRYQMLNLAASCRTGAAYRPTAAELALSNNGAVPTTVCQQDTTNAYGVVTPNIERFGASARFTTKLNDDTTAFLAFNFQQSSTSFTGAPATIRGNAPVGIRYARISTATGAGAVYPGSGILTLPVYVCPQGVGSINGLGTGCNAGNGTLNPNNPFAAQGQVARIVGTLYDSIVSSETRSRVYRAALGVQGTLLDGLDYRFDATAMHTDLRLKRNGYVYIQHLLDLIANGKYNFVNPERNSQEVRDYLTPEKVGNDSSDLYQAQVTFTKDLATLPGGPLQLGFGGSIFYEAVDAPSLNDDYNGPTQRFFTLNAFGTVGHRTVSSVFAEANAPVLDNLEINASGRYDHYSSGQSAFSPKVGAKFTPIHALAIRGTYSRGFRIPSFAEANALPTTGFVAQSVANIPASFLALYGANCRPDNSAGCPTYITAYSIGVTTLATPDLKPEKSRSFTAGIVFEPIRNVSLTIDYFNIRKTGAITLPSEDAAIAAYYAGTPIPPAFRVIADAPDPNHPTAKPRIAFVESQLINANTLESEGIDFGVSASHDFGSFKWMTNLDASLTLELSTTFPDGRKESYVDTLGNFVLTAGSGTFRWRGNWRNTIVAGPLSVSGTVNYTSGYDLSAMGQGTEYKDCGMAPGYFACRVKRYITADLSAMVRVNDKFSLYVNAINLFDTMPGVDPVTYGANEYNAVQAGNNIFGRQYRAGVKFNF